MENQSTTLNHSAGLGKSEETTNWLDANLWYHGFKKSILGSFVCLFSFWAIFFSSNLFAQNVSATWGTNASTAWYTGANWIGGSYSGVQGAAAANTNIATFTSGSTGNPIGINMGTASLNLGAISIDNTRVSALNLANSSGTAGVLRLYGATVNSIANTVVRNNGTGLFTMQSSANLMGIVLSNATDNKFTIDNTGGITIASLLSGTGNLTKDGAGSGVLTLTNSGNTYSGTTTITTGELRLNPSANATFASQVILNGGTLSTTAIALNRTWTSSSTLNLNANSTIALGSNSHTITFANSSAVSWAGTTLTVTGWTGTAGSSGTGGKIVVGAGGLTAGQLAKISFTGFPGTPIIVGGEVVPPGAGGPTFIPSPSSLTALDYVFGSGPSVAQTFTISASNLTGGGGTITFDATASPNYEVSTTSPGTSGYGATATLTYTGTGALAANTIWVRLKSGLAVGNYNSQSISISGGGANSSITASGSVTAIPYMVLPTLNTAVTENMDVMGTAASTSTITNVPVGFKAGTDWSTGTTVNTVAGGTTGAGTISAGGFYNFANGVNASATDRGLGYLFSGGFSSPRSIVLKFRNNTGSTVRQLDVAFDYEKYRNGQITLTNTFTHGATTTPSIAEPAGTQVYTTDGNNSLVNPPTTISKSFSLTGLSIANGTDYYFMWTFTGSASTNAIAVGIDNFSVTPRDQSLLTSVNSLSGFNYTGAGPSAEQSFTISGDNLGSNVVITPPTNYEISLTSGTGFVANPSTISITPVSGNIPGQPRDIFVRLKAGLAGGLYNGENITLTSGIINKAVTLNGGVVPNINLSADFNAGTEIGTTVVTLTATTSSAVSGAQTVTVGIAGSGITTGDYTLGGADLSGLTLTIPNAATSASFTFTIVNDVLNEGSETAAITISSPSAGLVLGGTVSQNVVISDNDDAIIMPTISSASALTNFVELANTGISSDLPTGFYFLETGSSANTTYTASSGSSSIESYSFGTGTSTERAFGSVIGGAITDVSAGFKVTNTTGSTINAIQVDFVGEQWQRGQTGGTSFGGAPARDKLLFQFSTSATSLSSGTWGSSSSLNFYSPDFGNTSVSARDGNNAAFRTVISNIFYLPAGLASGASIWVKWVHNTAGTSGSRDGLAIDNVSFTPLIVPSLVFYSDGVGTLDNLSSWWTNTDGTGSNPSNFTDNNQTFVVQANQNVTLASPLTISGTNSYLSILTGATVTVPSGSPLVSVVNNIDANATLLLNDATLPTLIDGLDPTSTVEFGSASAQNILIPNSGSYGNLSLTGGGTKTIIGGFRVEGNLAVSNTNLDATSGFKVVFFKKDISYTGTVTSSSTFKTNVNIQSFGGNNQTIFGNGNVIYAGRLLMNINNSGGTQITSGTDLKTGFLTLASNTDMVLSSSLKLNGNSGGSDFVDGGNTITIGGDLECAGNSSDYNFTGTIILNGSASTIFIRQDASGGSGSSIKAALNNLSIQTTGTAVTQVLPTSSAANITLKGDLTLGGTSIGKFTANQNTIKIGGNYSNLRNADLFDAGTSTLEFNGSAPQTFNTINTSGENFYKVKINNSNGVTMTSGNFNVNGSGSNLTCTSGLLTTGINKVVLSSVSTITETVTSHVIGLVETTRILGNSTETFGGIGCSVTAFGALPNNTTLVRETGISYNVGCLSSSLKRKYSFTPSTNSGLDAQLVFGYLPSVSELNGLTESSLGLFTGGGPWTLISTLSNLNIALNKITVNSLNSLGEYIVSSPSPNAVITPPATAFSCGATSTLINTASSTFGTLAWTHDGFGTISSSGSITPTYNANASDIGNVVTLTLTASNLPCPDATATYAISVVPIPTASITGSAPHAISCENGTVTVSGVSANDAVSVAWSIVPTGGIGGYLGAGSIISGGTSFSPTYQCNAADAGQNVTLQMVATGVGACTSNTVNFVINVRPRPTLTISPNSLNICNDVNGVFRTLSIASPEANTNYIWSPVTDLYIDPAFTTPYTGDARTTVYAVPFVTTNYSVTATNTISGCTTGATTITLNVCSALTNSICQADAPTPAVPVTSTLSLVTYSLLGATASAGVPCAPIARDVYYRVVVPSNGELHVITAPGTNAISNLNVQSTVVSIHYAVGGTCTTSPVVACNSGGAAGNQSYVFYSGMVPGSIAYIRLGSTVSGNPSSAQYVRMAVTNGLIWTGSANSSFNNPANWMGGDATALTVPSATKSVIIRSVTSPAVAPTIVGAQDVKNLTMQTNALMSIGAGATLSIKGDLNLSGNSISGTGFLEMNGTSAQVIGTTGRINYLKINNATGVSLGGAFRVGGLSLKLGTLTTNNNLTILSDAALTGYIDNFTTGNTGTLVGNVNMERRVVGTSGNVQHYLSTPVAHSATVAANYSDDFSVSGTVGYVYSSDPTAPQPSSFPTTWWYNETLTNVYTPGWTNASQVVLAPGQGFAANISGTKVIDAVGTLTNGSNTGSISRSLTFTDDGFNLVGNPYPSSISFNQLVSDNSSLIYPQLYLWNGAGSNYASYNGVAWTNNPAGSLSSDVMGHSQSWFVIAQSAGTLNFNNSQRTISSPANFFSEQPGLIRLEVATEAGKDEVVVYNDNNSTENFDAFVDAKKFLGTMSPVSAFTLSKDNMPLSINAMDKFDAEQIIPVQVVTEKAGMVTIKLNLADLKGNYDEVYLEDATLNKYVDLKATESYSAQVSKGNSGSRFFLHFAKPIALNSVENELSIYANQKNVVLTLPNESNGMIEILDMQGKTMYTANFAAKSGKTSYNISNVAYGTYLVRVISNGKMYSHKVILTE